MKTAPTHFVTVLRKSAKWLLLAAVVAFLAYRMEFAPAPVLAYEARPGPIIAEVMGTGTLEARVKTTISPRIQERLAEVLVDQNDAVKTGQLLARLDDGELKMQVEVAEAARVAARAGLERVETDEARALAVDKQARLNHQRVSDLIATKVASQDELDRAVESLQVAAADLKRSQAAIAEARSQVVTAEKNLAYQNERLSYARILSPYDGLVVRRDRDPGGVVVPGGSLLQLISTNEIWVSAWVDETAMMDLVAGQPARVVFRSEPGRNYPGEVARLGRETDRETREFLVDVRVKELPKNWTVGQRAEVFIETGRKSDALVIPQQFVQWREGKPGVFVNEHGKARWRAVTLGLRGRETVEITQGVSAGEQAVTPGGPKQPPLTDGLRISTSEVGRGKAGGMK
jgi:HlyD family secretion protein